MHREAILGGFKQAFLFLPDIVALVLAAVALALIFWTEVPKWLDNHRFWRWIVITACIGLGIGAFFANQLQKSIDTTDKRELRDQINILIKNSQTQATGDEVATVGSALTLGVQRLEDDIKRKNAESGKPTKPLPQDHTQAQPSPQPPEVIRSTQKRVPSADPNSPFGLQVIITSDVSYSPVELKLTFSGPIDKISFFMAGSPVMQMFQSFISPEDPNIGIVRIGYPPLSPETPMVVNVLSHTDVKLVSIEKASNILGARN
jgi:hypothetical protein